MKNIKMKFSRLSLLLIIIVSLSACSFSTHYVQSGSKPYNETNPENIELFAGQPTKEYIIIGTVAADAPDQEKAYDLLLEEAASMGADCIMNVEIHAIMTFGRLGINGVAVKYK